jgi:hypothetical protein
MLQNRLLISVVAAALAGFAFFNFALKPKNDEASKVKTQVAKAQDELTAAQQAVTANREAQQNFKRSYTTVVKLGKAVPGDDDVRSLVVQLDTTAKKAGVDFKSINVGGGSTGATTSPTDPAASAVQLPPGATVGPAGFPVMPFSFEFTGQFFKLGDFFRQLDSYVQDNNDHLSITGRLLTVDGLKLEPDTTGFPNIKATVAATSYLVSPLEGATGGATPAGPGSTVDPATGAITTPVEPTGTTSTALTPGVSR